jgi:PAS domain S-box-containing protein
VGKRILVVDNDRLCVEFLGDILTQHGYEVCKAYDGMEALEVLERQLPDVIFLDIVMPKIDGDRVFRYVRSNPRTAHIPVIIVSGTLAEEMGDILALGAEGYVAKSQRSDFQKNVLKMLARLDDGEDEATREVLGVENLVPRHKVRELLAIRRFLRTVLDTIPEAVVEVDGRQRILSVNRAGLGMIDRPELELIGSPLVEILGPDHRTTLEDAIAAFLKSGARPAEEAVSLRYGRRVLHVLFAWVNASEHAQGFFMTLRDVTDLARKIEELSELNARLQRMDQLRSELLTMVSHDLHTPLTAIKGALQMLLQETVGVELSRELLALAQKNADRLFRMVSDILDLARIEAGGLQQRREAFDLVAALRGTVDRLHRIAGGKGIAISVTAPDSLPALSADGLRIEQVFTNLLGNALKFTPRGGQITLTVKDLGAEVLVEFRDSGVGIPQEHLDRIFDRFYRVPVPAGTESEVEGTGLGLSICKAVVEDHGGRIWAESHLGQGSTFCLTLPKAV